MNYSSILVVCLIALQSTLMIGSDDNAPSKTYQLPKGYVIGNSHEKGVKLLIMPEYLAEAQETAEIMLAQRRECPSTIFGFVNTNLLDAKIFNEVNGEPYLCTMLRVMYLGEKGTITGSSQYHVPVVTVRFGKTSDDNCDLQVSKYIERPSSYDLYDQHNALEFTRKMLELRACQGDQDIFTHISQKASILVVRAAVCQSNCVSTIIVREVLEQKLRKHEEQRDVRVALAAQLTNLFPHARDSRDSTLSTTYKLPKGYVVIGPNKDGRKVMLISQDKLQAEATAEIMLAYQNQYPSISFDVVDTNLSNAKICTPTNSDPYLCVVSSNVILTPEGIMRNSEQCYLSVLAISSRAALENNGGLLVVHPSIKDDSIPIPLDDRTFENDQDVLYEFTSEPFLTPRRFFKGNKQLALQLAKRKFNLRACRGDQAVLTDVSEQYAAFAVEFASCSLETVGTATLKEELEAKLRKHEEEQASEVVLAAVLARLFKK